MRQKTLQGSLTTFKNASAVDVSSSLVYIGLHRELVWS